MHEPTTPIMHMHGRCPKCGVDRAVEDHLPSCPINTLAPIRPPLRRTLLQRFAEIAKDPPAKMAAQ